MKNGIEVDRQRNVADVARIMRISEWAHSEEKDKSG